MKVSCAHSELDVGVKYSTNEIPLRCLYQLHDVSPWARLSDTHPRNRYGNYNCDTQEEPCSIDDSRYFHCDHQSQRQWFVGFYNTWPSTTSVYWLFWGQNPRLRRIPVHPLVVLVGQSLWILVDFAHVLRSILEYLGDERQKLVTDLVNLFALDRHWE